MKIPDQVLKGKEWRNRAAKIVFKMAHQLRQAIYPLLLVDYKKLPSAQAAFLAANSTAALPQSSP